MSFFTLVDSDGKILLSRFTEDPNHQIDVGNKLLLDNPPNPPLYIPGKTMPIRIEPVPLNATEILYNIVDDPAYATLLLNEVSL